MSGSLQTAVLGMRAYQEMLNVAGNNLANADTIAFKEDRITFSDMFSRTISRGTRASEDIGGTNPVQVGRGVRVSMVDKNMSQGSFTSTEKDFDFAIDGEGFFVVYDGIGSLYTRDGTFDVDADGYLIDPPTGYRLQRIGSIGEESGFQTPGNMHIRIPYKTELPGRYTTEIEFTGNLSASEYAVSSTEMQSSLSYNLIGGGLANPTDEFADIEQLQDFTDGDTIDISGRTRDGTAVAGTFTYGAANDGTTLQDLLDAMTATFGGAAAVTCSMADGKISVSDAQEGYSLLDVHLSSASQPDALPADFDYVTVGGVASQPTSITIYDRQSRTHHLTATFVRQDENEHVWDLVVNRTQGAETIADRRIAGITFDENGTYQGVSGVDGFGHDPTTPGYGFLDETVTIGFPGIDTLQSIGANFGRPGFYEGLTQLGGDSSAGAIEQDGYGTGSLQRITVDTEGILRGTFSNGESLDIAAIAIAVFDNVQGLERAGSSYYRHTPAAGATITSRATQGRAGRIRQNVLEDSNVDIAREFTSLIVAQRGFQMNSRTVRVTNNILQQLASIVM